MSKYSVVIYSLILASTAIAGSAYLYRAGNQSTASQVDITQTAAPAITQSESDTLGPPSPTESNAPAPPATTTTGTTPSTTPSAPQAAPASVTTSPSSSGGNQSTVSSSPDSGTASTATQPTSSDATTAASQTNPSTASTTAPTAASSSLTTQTGAPTTPTSANIKKSIEAMTLHRTLSSDQSIDAVLFQFSILVPNYAIKMTILSDPIVVQTKSNNAGQVTYRLANVLGVGNHSVTVVLADPNDATKTISASRTFNLPQIKTSNELNASAGLSNNQIIIPIQYIMALLGSIVVAGIAAFILFRSRNSRHQVINLEG